MLNIPILRWGTPYESLEKEEIFHFITGEPVAKVSQANTGLLARDMRKVERARECLREIPAGDLIEMMKKLHSKKKKGGDSKKGKQKS